jgi:pre-mRNA-processing factor 6
LGAQEKREDVINKCIASEPKHGEVWQSVAKDPKLIASGKLKSPKDILMIVVDRLEEQKS